MILLKSLMSVGGYQWVVDALHQLQGTFVLQLVQEQVRLSEPREGPGGSGCQRKHFRLFLRMNRGSGEHHESGAS